MPPHDGSCDGADDRADDTTVTLRRHANEARTQLVCAVVDRLRWVVADDRVHPFVATLHAEGVRGVPAETVDVAGGGCHAQGVNGRFEVRGKRIRGPQRERSSLRNRLVVQESACIAVGSVRAVLYRSWRGPRRWIGIRAGERAG